MIVISVIADHAAKHLARSRIHGWFSLVHRCNSGVSWSFGSGHGSVTLMVTSVVALAVAIAAWWARPGAASWGAGLIVGGAVGNVLSRLTTPQRCVTDYLAVGHFFVANVQDVAITAGVLLWMLSFLQKDGPGGREHI